MLEITELNVTTKGKELLHSLTLTVPDGEVHAILGPNGSGKTTLLMTIMGFSEYHITHGQILFNGKDITNLSLTERARLGIGLAQQRPPAIQGVRLGSLISYLKGLHQHDDQSLKALIQEARMEPFLDRDINEGLSGGEIKRSELLQMLVASPSFPMIDEPDSGVDLEALSVVGSLIQKLYSVDPVHPAKRKAGLIITHGGNILGRFPIDRAHVLYQGQIGCSGNPQVVMQTIKEHGYLECIRCIGQKHHE